MLAEMVGKHDGLAGGFSEAMPWVAWSGLRPIFWPRNAFGESETRRARSSVTGIPVGTQAISVDWPAGVAPRQSSQTVWPRRMVRD
jgi:hypothetical protein